MIRPACGHFGYRRDTGHRRLLAKPAVSLLGTAIDNLPPASTLRPYVDQILDQGPTGSCTGHGTAQGIYIAMAAAGAPLGWMPSPAAIYANTRAIERKLAGFDLDTPLQDNGAMPADVMRAISEWGIRPMGPFAGGRRSDVDESNVNSEPSLLDLETEARKIVTGEYRIQEGVGATLAQVRATIALHSAPVGVGFFADTRCMDWHGGDTPLGAPDTRDPNGGGHWTMITGFETLSSGAVVLEVLNSWGTDYGDGGFFRVSEAWLGQVFDLYAMTVRAA